MLKPLAERELIDRTSDPKTNRAVVVSLTPAGSVLAKQVEAVWRRVERKLCAAGESNDRLLKDLESLRAALGGSTPKFVPYRTEGNP